MAVPVNYPLSIYRGDTFALELAWATSTSVGTGSAVTTAPVDMTGCSILSQIKVSTDYNAALYATFTVVNFVPAAGTWTLLLPAGTFATDNTWNIAYWDCQITDSNGSVLTLLAGEVTVTYDVSR